MCSIALERVSAEKRLVMTLRPVRALNVRGRTNSSAARVMITLTVKPRVMRARASSAALYAAMPPPTPRARFILFPADGGQVGNLPHWRRTPAFCLLFGCGQVRGLLGGDEGQVFVLHQAAAHFFHGDYGGFLRGGGQIASWSTLLLAGSLGSDDDETVGAGFRIVGDNALGGVSNCSFRHCETSPKSDGFLFPSGRAGCGLL